MDFNANRRYLLEKTQHMIGGFGKMPGDPPGKSAIAFLSLEIVLVEQRGGLCCIVLAGYSLGKTLSFQKARLRKFRADIMHSYLGLAALASMREPLLKSVDPTLCLSVDARERFESRVKST